MGTSSTCTEGGFCAAKSQPFRIALYAMAIMLVASALFAAALPESASSQAAGDDKAHRVFTEEELIAFDGQDGRPAYTAYDGVIYDVTDSPTFKEGGHFGHALGKDLTPSMAEAPHGEEVFAGFAVMGRLQGYESVGQDDGPERVVSTRAGEGGRILLLGFSVLAWSGFVFAIVFILAFATCYAMPWSKRQVAWKGVAPGPDTYDGAGTLRWNFYHSIFAWATIIMGILHGVIGIFQSFGYYI